MGELDVSELSGKAFSRFRILLKSIERQTGYRFKYRRRDISSDRKEPAIVSKVELSERLLEEVIERIESTEAKYSYGFPFMIASEIPFNPESATLRCSLDLFLDISFLFGMAEVIALDRLMKQMEDCELAPEYGLVVRASIRLACVCAFNMLSYWPDRDRRWHLQQYIERLSDAAAASPLEDAFTVVVAAVLHLLAFVFQYLIGCVDRGGSKTYSSGSFDFRATFVSLVLFQGAYVWIKFRQAAPVPCRKRRASDSSPKGIIYRRAYKDKAGNPYYRYEPRFPLRKEEIEADEGTNRLPLGGYPTLIEAEIVLQSVRLYYGPDGENGGIAELESSGFLFLIPPVSENDAGKKKRTWVPRKAMELVTQTYKDFLDFQEKQLHMGSEIGGHGHDAGSSDPSPSALPLTSSFPTTIATEPVTGTEAPLWPSSSSLPSCDGTIGGFPDTPSDWNEMFTEPFCLGSPNLPPQQSSLVTDEMHYQGFAPIHGDSSSTQGEGLGWDTEHGQEPHFSPSVRTQQGSSLVDAVAEKMDTQGPGLFLQPSDPVLQQPLDSQQKQMENVLKLTQIQISQLQQENQRLRIEQQQEKEVFEREKERLRIEQQQEKEVFEREKERLRIEQQQEKEVFEREKERLHQENVRLKSKLEQMAKSQIAAWTGIMIDIQQRD